MGTLKGIKFTRSSGHRYVRIDLDMYEGYQALEDFLDIVEVEAQKDEPKRELREILQEQYQKRGLDVPSHLK